MRWRIRGLRFHAYSILSHANMLKLNAVLAVILGLALAVGESIRRFDTQFFLPFLLDDYIMCGLLTLGAWRAHRSSYKDLSFLMAGWSFTCGMLYLSFFANLEKYMINPSSSGISSPVWVILIFTAFVTSIFGTLSTLIALRQAMTCVQLGSEDGVE